MVAKRSGEVVLHRAGAWLAAGAAVLVFALLLRLQVGTPFVGRAIDDIGQDASAAVAALACALRAARSGGRSRLSWWLLAAALASWSAGEAIWSWYELVIGRQTPFPSPADIGFLLFPLLALTALLVRPSPAYSRSGRMRVLLDGAMVASALFVLSWQTTLGTVYAGGADNTLALVVGLAYPCGDLILLVTAVLVVLHSRVQGADLLLITGLVAMAVADSGFSYLTATGAYRTGSVVDLAWFAAFVLMALSAVLHRQGGAASGAREDSERVELLGLMALPYVFVVLGAVTTVVGVAQDGVDLVAVSGFGVALVALLARQLLTVLDNRQLAQSLLARQHELSFQAFHDGLTGLANRALFYDRVAHALDLHRRDMRPVSMLFCDLDDFKSVNDSLGHDAGDEVLVAVALRLRSVVRTGDTLARLGGDEFAILLEDDGDTAVVAERIRRALDEPVAVHDRVIPVRASVGRTTVDPADGHADVQRLLKQADVAMYAAKRMGKGGSVDYSASAGAVGSDAYDRRLALIAELSAGRIGTALQPIVRMDGAPYAAEALVRWTYRSAQVEATDIVSMAEREGKLADLDLLVARNALVATAQHRMRTGISVITSINLGLTRFVEADIAARLQGLLEELDIAPRTLVVEVTERDLLDPAVLHDALRSLRDIGVGIAIDDFGVGQSNLSRLGDVAPDIVKLDRSFVAPLADPGYRPTLLRGIVSLAHDLGATVVGEGVEYERQLDVLQELGCDAVQGYLLGRPELVAAQTTQRVVELGDGEVQRY